MHGRDYAGQNLAGWIATEKFNGHRVRWQDGELITRFGNKLPAPSWFTAGIPDVWIDMELFASRAGGHDEVTSLLRRGDWRKLSLIPFDLPNVSRGYLSRNMTLFTLDLPEDCQPCEPCRLGDNEEAFCMLSGVEKKGGEGLMLHHPDAHYSSGKVRTLLKLFPSMGHLVLQAA